MDTENVTGLDALDAVLAQFGQRAVDEAANLLEARGETIMGDSKANFVPVDQSTLQGSGHVEAPKTEGTQVSVRLAYGGPAAPYAEAIHEHLSAHSPRTWKIAEASGRGVHFTQGGPKYLELPYLKGIAGLGQWIADGIKSRLGT
jgi:hypothetical protein